MRDSVFRDLVQTPVYPAILGLLCGLVGFRIGWRLALAWVLPLSQGAMGALAFAAAWRGGGAAHGAIAVGGWTVGSTLAALVYFLTSPGLVDRRVLRAAAYRAEMLAWLSDGRGFAARPLATARRHLWELGAYLAAALVSGNVLGLVMGAVLLNFMNAWVASLLRAARRPSVVLLLGWNVWSVVRVAAYAVLGTAAAAPLAAWIGRPAAGGLVGDLLLWGLAGVAADLALKLGLSGATGRALAAAVDLRALALNRSSGDLDLPDLDDADVDAPDED